MESMDVTDREDYTDINEPRDMSNEDYKYMSESEINREDSEHKTEFDNF